MARWGIAKTTLDDVARQAGCSRASVYRAFPGGKDALLRHTIRHEVICLFAAVDRRVRAADALEDAVVAGVVVVGRSVRDHAALQFVLAHEPELILPRLAFGQMDALLAAASGVVAPRLARWVPASEAARVGEWVSRLVVSYLVSPSADVDLTDEASVRRLVRRFVLPALGTAPDGAGPGRASVPGRRPSHTSGGETP